LLRNDKTNNTQNEEANNTYVNLVFLGDLIPISFYDESDTTYVKCPGYPDLSF